MSDAVVPIVAWGAHLPILVPSLALTRCLALPSTRYGPRMGSAVFFVLLWGVYITVSSLKSMCKIDFEM